MGQQQPLGGHFTGHAYLTGIEDTSKPARTKKKKTTEKNPVSATSRDDSSEVFEDDLDGFDADIGEGGVSKDIKRQMRYPTLSSPRWQAVLFGLHFISLRLVKNRQAAQQFRKRQKQYIQDLEKRCSALAAQNASFGYGSRWFAVSDLSRDLIVDVLRRQSESGASYNRKQAGEGTA